MIVAGMPAEMRDTDKKTKAIIIAVAVSGLVIFSAFTVYDLNGRSFDLSDSEIKLVVTGSMDAFSAMHFRGPLLRRP